jgi:hypothetical protein
MSGGVGLVFKGSGFYSTDYKKSNTSSSANTKSDSKSDTLSETKPNSKEETKPDSKKEPKPSADTSSSAEKK